VCDGGYTNVSCASTADCPGAAAGKKETCHGHQISCQGGYCATGFAGGVLCVTNASSTPTSATSGGTHIQHFDPQVPLVFLLCFRHLVVKFRLMFLFDGFPCVF
jgi:hypothetical protein